jgi:hypothetical protein
MHTPPRGTCCRSFCVPDTLNKFHLSFLVRRINMLLAEKFAAGTCLDTSGFHRVTRDAHFYA